MRRRRFLKSSSIGVSSWFLRYTVLPGIILRPAKQLFAALATDADTDYAALRSAFQKPPNDNQNWTRWWWFGPNATEEGIAYELEQMKKQGLGGIEMQWMTPLELEDNFEFLSERWAQLVKFTVQKAKQLGMRVDFTLGTGWPYGGPWIPIELASKCLKMTVDDVLGPRGEGIGIPGGLGEQERLVALFAVQTKDSGNVLDPLSIKNLTPYLRYSDPKFWAVVRPPVGWPMPPGRWKVISLKQVFTRQAVRTAALGNEGLVLDHFCRKALERHLEVAGGAFKKAIGEEFGKTVRAVFCDSFEIHLPLQSFYWTDDLLAEFKKRKGYDLAPHLLALWFDVGDRTPRIRHDFIHVLSQLILENFFIPLREWCEQNNLKSCVQSHGSIAEIMEGYGVNSIPEGEQATSGEPQISMHRKYASSAAHIYGRPLVSSESFTFLTAPGYPGSFRYVTNLEIMKAAVDPALRDGYQEIINHGYSYNDPDEKTEPFIEMYASAVVRHTQPWWQYYHQFTDYLARCCSLLSQGHFVGDIAILSPVPDAWCKARPPEVLFWSPEATIQWGDLAPLIVRSGYDFNLVNDQVFVEKSRLENGKLVIGGMKHSILILPKLTYIPVATMERVRDFCQGGGMVIATERLPEFATDFENWQANDQRVQEIVRKVFGDIGPKQEMVSREFGKGKAIWMRALSGLPALLRAQLQPDFELEQPVDSIVHLHRRLGELDVYFVTNNSDSYQENSAAFRVGKKIPELWNPETGEYQPAPLYSLEKDSVRVALRLKPYESVFYIFREAPEPVHATETNADEIVSSGAAQVRCRTTHNGVCYIRTAGAGRKPARKEIEVKDLPAPLEVSGNWQITFQAYKFSKLVKQMAALYSWTDDPETRHFSGTARYELEFEVPANLFAKGRGFLLDLGTVADASKVWLNSNAAGVTWKKPHRHDVTRWIRPGKNFLEVRVSNRLINMGGGMQKPDWVEKVVEKYGHYNERHAWYEINVAEYGTQNLPPAGLLGPVLLIPVQEIEFSL